VVPVQSAKRSAPAQMMAFLLVGTIVMSDFEDIERFVVDILLSHVFLEICERGR
jgi:hypothetical protein